MSSLSSSSFSNNYNYNLGNNYSKYIFNIIIAVVGVLVLICRNKNN